MLMLSSDVLAEDDFYYGEYAAIPFEGYFDLDNQMYVFIETYDPTFAYFYFYDSNGEICYIESTLDADGAISGLTISDPWELCPTVGSNNWSDIQFTLNDQGTLASYVGPQGSTWDIYDSDTLFA